MTPKDDPREVGIGPYRSLAVQSPRAARRLGRIVAVGFALAAVSAAAVAGWRFDRARRTQEARRIATAREVAELVALSHGGTMAGGPQVTIVEGEGDRAVVVRLPGVLVRRGTDVVRRAEVLRAPGVVALMPDGGWAVRRDGNVILVGDRMADGCTAGRCAPRRVTGHGRVLQVGRSFGTRLEDGAVGSIDGRSYLRGGADQSRRVVDLGVSGGTLLDDGDVELDFPHTCRYGHESPDLRSSALRVPSPVQLVKTGIREYGGLVCVRGERGDVACGTPHIQRLGDRSQLRPVRIDGATRIRQVALSDADLCLVGLAGTLSCVVGPAEDLAFDNIDVFSYRMRRVLEGVTEVALSDDVSCARRSGEVVCWGQPLQDGGIVRRDAAVEVAGLDAVEGLVTFGDYVCAVQRGAVLCWGALLPNSPPHPRPTPVALPGRAVRLNRDGGRGALCATLAEGPARCWEDDPFATPSRAATPADLWPNRDLSPPRTMLQCGVAPGGAVTCRWDASQFGASRDSVLLGYDEPPVVPGVGDAVEVAVTYQGLACARRASGRVSCWGSNVGGVLTAGEGDSPRLFTLRELLARSGR